MAWTSFVPSWNAEHTAVYAAENAMASYFVYKRRIPFFWGGGYPCISIKMIPCTEFRVRQEIKHFAWWYSSSKRNNWRKDDKTGTEIVWDVMGHRLLVHVMFNMWRHILAATGELFRCCVGAVSKRFVIVNNHYVSKHWLLITLAKQSVPFAIMTLQLVF